ncbi:GSCFA domain-containing protein [Falsiroseomonas ponticola]|uniref:GSCFA domain-containing protein n=1 Tax=Falsiroseomonas ponticola TaxID=2786951 RepID=UPI0019334414|nr:GSCFA domain-containing protein [Roseomonas ponticola]
MQSPYANLPDRAFWGRSVARPAPEAVDPTDDPPFRLTPEDRIATAGSCFAQHISRALLREGFNYIVTEAGPEARNYGVYPARFGNIYSTRQMLQLFQRAYGLFSPVDEVWRRPDGAFVDPFRPQVEPDGFRTVEALVKDRTRHLAAVRTMFETCDVFVFTLGLTETWECEQDGAVVPLAPGVAGAPEHASYRFVNRRVAEMTEDLTAFITKLRLLRPDLRVILTVSPVPLIATYEPRHVLVSTIYSKSALRVVAEEVSQSLPDVAYFPSYEIITGHHARYGHFADDLRSVQPTGVDHVLGMFKRRFLAGKAVAPPPAPAAPRPAEKAAAPAPKPVPSNAATEDAELEALYKVVCDEEALDP